MRNCRRRLRLPRAMPQAKAPPARFAAWPGRNFPASKPDTAVRLLVTRPRDDAEPLAEKLRLSGHEPVLAPLLELRFRQAGPISLHGIQAILATSANGVRGIAAALRERNLPIYVVGPQSAEAARREGFASVIS